MEDKEIIINKYKESLVDDYYSYLDVIDELNSKILLYTDNHAMLFSYSDFCKSFLENLKEELKSNVNFTKYTISNIFMIMVEDRILDIKSSLKNKSEY